MALAMTATSSTTRCAPAAAVRPRPLALRAAPTKQRRPRGDVSAAAAVAIAPEYGYVIAAVAVNAAMLQWQAIRVFIARKTYKVAYPQVYAGGNSAEAVTFDCIQRSHQNTLEYAPALTALVVMLGLVHPIYAAALDLAWVVGRVVYTLGYSTGFPEKRIPGAAISGLAYIAAIVSALVTGVRTTGLLPF